jgi:hypothetical protein
MASVAERAISRRPAAAQRKRRLPRQIDFIALGVDHLHQSIGIFDAQRPVGPNRDRNLSHKTSEQIEERKSIVQNELVRRLQASGFRCQVSGVR